jgi:peptidoglycan/xylan/chitin deacetylase (PgdA/CDA1 family)
MTTALQSFDSGLVGPKDILITFDDGYQDFYTLAFPILQEFGYAATVFPIIEAVGHWNEWNRRAPYIAYHLSWSQIDELAKANVVFGCHTLSHHSLVRFEELRLREELGTAQNLLAQRIGQPVEVLSYPYGDYNDLVKRITAELFRAAFAVDRGEWDGRADRFAIRRLKIGPAMSLEHFQARLNSFEADYHTPQAHKTEPETPEIKT